MEDNIILTPTVVTPVSTVTPRLELGIDEFTLVLQPLKAVPISQWSAKANEMIREFLNRSLIEILFEEVEFTQHRLVQGYNTGYDLPERFFYFCICYHTEEPTMGVCCKFSATAYSSYKQKYLEKYNGEINISTFLKIVKSDAYNLRLSRIDLDVDYFNYPNPLVKGEYLHPDSIYNGLLRNTICVVDRNCRHNLKSIAGYNNNGVFDTVYVGSRKGKTKGFLRIYDKRDEQIQTHGVHLTKALLCESWIRFEAVFKSTYAHQIGESLIDDCLVTSDDDLLCFIANKFIDKYNFINSATGEALSFTEDLQDIASGQPYDALESPSARDNSLARSLKYLFFNSGLMITLAKADFLFPEQLADRKIMDWLYDKYKSVYLNIIANDDNHEIYKWLRKHSESIQEQSLEEIFNTVDLEIRSEHKASCENTQLAKSMN